MNSIGDIKNQWLLTQSDLVLVMTKRHINRLYFAILLGVPATFVIASLLLDFGIQLN